MAKLTQQAIRASFLRLLARYPLRQITVQMITDDCGVNRKTFYYHYADIPALLEEIITEHVRHFAAEYQGVQSLEECLDAMLDALLREKNVVLNICACASYDTVLRGLRQICDALTDTYVAASAAAAGLTLTPRGAELAHGYYRSVCMGLITDWLLRGMPEDVKPKVHCLCALRSGMTGQFLQHIAEQTV